MIHILYGADDFSAHEALAEIKRSLGNPEDLASNTSVLEGGKLTPAELQAAVETYPFLSPHRLVIVSGLLERFERQKAASAPGKSNASAQDFAGILKGAPPTTVAVLTGGAVKKTNPLLMELAGKADIREFAAMREDRLKEWIKKRFIKSGGEATDEAAALLARLAGANLWTLSSEIDKMISFKAGQRVEAADVETATPASREAGVFEFLDAIMEGRGTTAQSLLQAMLRDGQAPSYILFMMARQLRLLVCAKGMLAEGLAEGAIQTRLGIQGFVLGKTLEQARRFSLLSLKTCYQQLLETDLAIKTGKYDEDVAAAILAAEACIH